MGGLPLAVAVRPFAAGDDRQWDEFVLSCPAGTVFHLAAWKRVIERAFGHPTRYLIASRGARVTGVLPLTRVSSLLFGSSLISNAFAVYGGPIAEDDDSMTALERAAVALMEREAVPVLELRGFSPTRADWPTRSDLYACFRKPLEPAPEANLKAIPRKQRAMVRKGIRNGLRAEIDGDVDRLYRIYAESVRNLGTPTFAKAYFRIIREEFPNSSDILTVSHDGRPVAAVLSLYFRDEALPFYGGGLSAARDLAANDFMYWEVMRRACLRGCRLFDFGRSKIGTGAHAFKRNWGFTPTPLAYQFHLAAGRSMPNINPLNPKFRPLIAAWRRLPLPVAMRLGPWLVRGIG
jgi:FemAB-related protein (PEP-CTERM system-associated)